MEEWDSGSSDGELLSGKNVYGEKLLSHKEKEISKLRELLELDFPLDYTENSLRKIDSIFHGKKITYSYFEKVVLPMTLYLGECMVRLYPEKEFKVKMSVDKEGHKDVWYPILIDSKGREEYLFVMIYKRLEGNIYSDYPPNWEDPPMIGTLFLLTTNLFKDVAPSPSQDKDFNNTIFIDEE